MDKIGAKRIAVLAAAAAAATGISAYKNAPARAPHEIDFTQATGLDCSGKYPAVQAVFRDVARRETVQAQFFWRDARGAVEVKINRVGMDGKAEPFDSKNQKRDFITISGALLKAMTEACSQQKSPVLGNGFERTKLAPAPSSVNM